MLLVGKLTYCIYTFKTKETFESRSLRVNLGKIKVIVIGSINKDGKVDPCGVCSLRVKVSTVLCLQCGKWMHGRSFGVKRVTEKFSINCAHMNYGMSVGEAVEQEGKLYDEVEAVRFLAYLGGRVSARGGCEAAGPRSGWLMFSECGELLYGRRFPLRLKGAVYKSYARPAILCESEAWCVKESELGILRWTERSMLRAMCGVQLKDWKRSTALMFMLG